MATSKGFARLYDKYFTGFASSVQQPLIAYLEQHISEGLPRSGLDLCCGTGTLVAELARRGYRVYGIDHAEAMLDVARERTAALPAGQVVLLRADATTFELPQPVSFVTSTFDALNYLPDLEALGQCASAVRKAVHDGGVFVFDLHTQRGLRQTNQVSLRDGEDDFFVSRVIYEPTSQHLVARTSGFSRNDDTQWTRFDEVVVQVAHPVADVLGVLHDCGWKRVWPARLAALDAPLDEPEAEVRTFFVAHA